LRGAFIHIKGIPRWIYLQSFANIFYLQDTIQLTAEWIKTVPYSRIQLPGQRLQKGLLVCIGSAGLAPFLLVWEGAVDTERGSIGSTE
jgi:hypothetical protein